MTNEDAKATYERQGVAKAPKVLSAAEVAQVRAELARHQERMADLPTSDYTLEPDKQTVRNFWRLDRHAEFFRELALSPALLDLVGPLVGGDPELTGVETFNKPAKVGSEVPYHQDNAYFCQLPADMLTLWIAIDPATKENGAVEYLVGSHRELLPHAPSGVKGNSFMLADQKVGARFTTWQGILEPGDALLHHCQVIHRSDPNRSDNPRLSLVIVYRGRHTTTDPTLKAAYEKAVTMTPPNA